MDAYAVVEAGGKQYLVKAKDKLDIETVDAEVGKTVELGPVLAISDGTSLKVGTPAVAGAKVVATVLKQFRAEKVLAFKKKRRKGYRKLKGHRQYMTSVQVESIG